MDIRSKRRTPDAIPVAGLDRLGVAARRTTLLRFGLALAAIALLAAAVLTARDLKLPADRLIPSGQSGVIALDLSRSVNGSRQAEAARVLERFTGPGQRVGLVVFSDTAYEFLPPGSPGTELERLIHLLTPQPVKPGAKKLKLPETPWDVSFRSGTVISEGLAMARRALVRHGQRKSTIVLVSDLSALAHDLPRVANEIIALRRRKIELRVVPVSPTAADRATFEVLVGSKAFVTPESLGRGGSRELAASVLDQPVPGGLVGIVLVLLGVLAVNELWCGRLLGRSYA
jgi:von Willebrand factor type A domain